MDVFEAIKSRRNIRKYSRQPVEFEKVMMICEAGMHAPSAGNIQNWRFVILRDKDMIKESLCPACLDQGCVEQAQVAIVVCVDDKMMERQYGLRGTRLYSIQGAAACIQNMLLAAHALGLGAAWVGAFNEERLNSLLEIPDDVARPQAVITLGYPAEEPDEKRMRHIDDVCRFDSFTARYKDIHRTLGDISIEWEKQAKKAKDRLKRKFRK